MSSPFLEIGSMNGLSTGRRLVSLGRDTSQAFAGKPGRLPRRRVACTTPPPLCGTLPETMTRMKQWLERYLPALFQPNETVVQVDIGGVQLTLRDWEGSNVLAIVPKEILDDDYRLASIDF